MPADRWQFWIDVGGTFTDCLARRPDGTLLRRKVLSSGVTKGAVEDLSNRQLIVDSRLWSLPDNFWVGYSFRLLDWHGKVVDETEIAFSDSAVGLQTPLRVVPEIGQPFQIHSPEEAPILAIRLFRQLLLDEPIPPCIVRLGTTRGTNALLARRGAKVGFVTTRGHGDVLHIGYQNRPKLFELAIRKPEPLFAEVAEIHERVASDGRILRLFDREQARSELLRLKAAGIESIAICLLNAYANPVHEEQVATLAREIGFDEISLSTRVSPLMKLVPRGDTTVVDAYLNPVLRTYVHRLTASLPGSDVRLMTSAGGLAMPGNFTGKDSILSGPAGGVVGFSRAAEAVGFDKAIGFDMGGTSTDVSRYDGRFEYEFETEKAGVRIVAPMLAMETVAAGGGSICRWDGMKLVVGPHSAGADPGPACYGRGGPLTVTDCNFYLGRLLPEHFPFPLDRPAAERRLEDVVRQSPDHWSGCSADPTSLGDSPRPMVGALEAVAAGFIRIANANMAQAIRSISLAKGYDPRDYVLVAFGSAGPQHTCAVAAELDIRRILVHPDAGVLSALGIGLANIVKHRSAGVYRSLDDACRRDLGELFSRLDREATEDLLAEATKLERVSVTRSLDLRYQGTDAALTIAEPAGADYSAAFAAEHRRLFGYEQVGRPIEVVAARVQVVQQAAAAIPRAVSCEPSQPAPMDLRPVFFHGQMHATPLHDRLRLRPGARLIGPAIVVEPLTTTIIDPGWECEVLSGGELLLAAGRAGKHPDSATSAAMTSHPETDVSGSPQPDPVLLELMSNHFTAIATQMGITLRNTAMSVNVKERLDFSCAIFTARGDLVVNAPHIPVHLGAMAETVKAILADNPAMQPGDVFVTNDPYRGGSHLPDVTVVTPMFAAQKSKPVFFTANRAHHAEIGGITPGSVPPFSRNLAEEGVLIRNFKLLDAGQARLAELRDLLAAGPHPSRSPDTNLADIAAQLAANQQGVTDLERLIDKYLLPVVLAYMQHIQEAAERKLRATLTRLPCGRREFFDHLDDGTPIRAAITIEGESATIDFSGSGPVTTGNLNANRAIVTAAVMYVLRLLVGEDIPLNQGVLAPVRIILPEGLLNPPAGARPEDCPAVVGGNVETSQRVVDVLLGALGLAAASQGTMNNLLFGDRAFGYYETICGGSGATNQAPGADAVHTHMTNTRLTDPEVLEAHFPVRLVEFAIRRGSGGAGRHRGGDGVIRRIEFEKPLTLSFLSQRRGPYAPYGLEGGGPGALGRNTLQRADGTIAQLAGSVQLEVHPGDVLTIETPGGGGWGEPQS
jgi:5-oxoprolinase (ATP-hydrolysing)